MVEDEDEEGNIVTTGRLTTQGGGATRALKTMGPQIIELKASVPHSFDTFWTSERFPSHTRQ